ncbi:uncharacterized protein [Procambarus clarkii]|uniref:uncharacterized protein n=1 Tax=Procambarus clarkii TaxID=6728 RepID=UPI001E6733AB|nr:uncharacterized protein LOC123753048 [Procambarus clarkii]XP_045591020.1 uncharacterized protein LOC123753048 [Procambarus clarkii]
MKSAASAPWRLAEVALTVFAAAVSAASATPPASSIKSLLGSSLGSESVNHALDWDMNSTNRRSDVANRPRVKRQFITFPQHAYVNFYFKLLVPYWTFPRVQTIGDYRFEIYYVLPDELLRLHHKRSLANDRSAIYSLLEDFFSKAGLDGEACVLRAVCEVGEAPLEEYGIFGEIINLVFAPSFQGDTDQRDYIQAEEYGRSYGNCWSAFPDCPMSMREVLHEFFLNNGKVPSENGP